MSDVVGKLVDSLFENGEPASPGSYKFYKINESDETAGLNFVCPCGCNAILGVRFYDNGWQWNGSKDKPTTNPSILRLDGCKWHGYLTDGIFKSC